MGGPFTLPPATIMRQSYSTFGIRAKFFLYLSFAPFFSPSSFFKSLLQNKCLLTLPLILQAETMVVTLVIVIDTVAADMKNAATVPLAVITAAVIELVATVIIVLLLLEDQVVRKC